MEIDRIMSAMNKALVSVKKSDKISQQQPNPRVDSDSDDSFGTGEESVAFEMETAQPMKQMVGRNIPKDSSTHNKF